MNKRTASLRARLLVLILVPLILIAGIVGYWRYTVARTTAEQIFDRNLVALTLAVARDVAISGGDALSFATTDMMRTASEAEVFYHVHGPDGVFVTGYAYPPPAPVELRAEEGAPHLYVAAHRGEPVRVARLTERILVDGISGIANVTVWQRMHEREAFARELGIRTGIVIVTLILTVAAVVWFGINLGLKPLLDLQDAISVRTSDDLSRIRRPVPREVKGLVVTINSLFAQVSDSIASRDRFISDAAHQLRNPIAGLGTLAEATRTARTARDARARAQELAEAAQRTNRLTQQLLSYERIRGAGDRSVFAQADLNEITEAVCLRNAEAAIARGIDFGFDPFSRPLPVHCNRVLLEEALENLIQNAMQHGGPKNTGISVSVSSRDNHAVVQVRDLGRGIPEEDFDRVFERFAQSGPSEGSGLGLPIVEEIIRLHGGDVHLERPVEGPGALATIRLPFEPM